MPKEKKESKRDLFLAELAKNFGRGVALAGNELSLRQIKRIPFGILQLDYLTQGGIPAERVTMIHGREGGTKSTTALMLAKSYLDRCNQCYQLKCKCKNSRSSQVLYLDAELKCESEGIKALGIDFDRFILVQPLNSEQAIDILEKALRNESIGFVVVDSIASMCPQVEIDATAGEWQMGIVAREINKLFRKMLAAMIARTRANTAPTVIVINQEREKIGVTYGNPIVLPGGGGQRFTTWLTLRVWSHALKTKQDNPHDDPILRVSAVVIKHAYGPSGHGAEYVLAMGDTSDGLKFGEARDWEFVKVISEKQGFLSWTPNLNGSGPEKKGHWKVEGTEMTLTQEALKMALAKREELYWNLRERVVALY